MTAFLVLARMRLNDVLRSRSATFAFLGLPLVILLVLVTVFSRGQPFEDKRVIWVNEVPGAAGPPGALTKFAGLRVERETDVRVAERKLLARAANAVVVVTDDRLTVEVGKKDELWGRGLSSVLGPHVELAPLELPPWGYVHYLFPGLLCSSVMFAGMFGMGYAMARYRRNQFLKKLSTLPLSRSTFVAAQIAGRGTLVAVQAGLLLIAGACLGLPLTALGVLATGVVCALGMFVFCGIGFALAALIETEAVVSDVISGLTLPFTLLSGMFFPLDTLPSWLGRPCAFLPSTLMVDCVRATLLYEGSLASLWPKLCGLLVWGVATFGLSVRLFRWHQ